MKLSHLLGLFFCLFVLNCCKKQVTDPDSPEPHVAEEILVSEELKQKWLFNPGSYWIVRDSVNATTDSIYITGIVSTKQLLNGVNRETITMNFNKDDLFPSLILTTSPDQIYTKLSNINLLIFTTDSTITDTSSRSLTNGERRIYFNKVLSNFTVGGTNYPSVRSLYMKYGGTVPSSYFFTQQEIFWCTGIGIIRRVSYPEIPQAIRTYEVIRYKIVK